MLKKAGVFFGTSITVTNENLESVTSDEYVAEIKGKGGRLFFFVEYVPIKEGTEVLVPDQIQREALIERTKVLRSEKKGLFIAFPGDEDLFGGCLSAGRGFAHINPFGHLEPCPFAPYHDVDLKDMSLKEALNSRFLREIRSNREMLSEVNGGCALWIHRDWVRSLSGSH
jgi:MoaA/NifB/PqqE/SkfB family radical SAM enzyme